MRGIIIEGMDNTGKTTLAKTLSDELSLRVVKSPGPYKENHTYAMSWLQMACQMREVVIFDRLAPFSEEIYGTIIRHCNLFRKYYDWPAVIDMVTIGPPLIIYCRPPDEVIFKFGEREQMDGVIQNRMILLRQYDFLMETLPNTHLHRYDFTKTGELDSIKTLCKAYLNLIKMERGNRP